MRVNEKENTLSKQSRQAETSTCRFSNLTYIPTTEIDVDKRGEAISPAGET